MTKLEIIRNKAHLSISFKNTYQRLASIAIEKHNWKMMDEYRNWALVYDFESSAYNECLETFGEIQEKTDEIAETVFNREMERL